MIETVFYIFNLSFTNNFIEKINYLEWRYTEIAVLLKELEDNNLNIKISSLLGLGIVCVGSQKERINGAYT